MGKSNFSDEFKRDAVAQITERGYPVAEVSERLGVSQHSLYAWKRQLAQMVQQGCRDSSVEARTGPGDRGARHPKKATAYLTCGHFVPPGIQSEIRICCRAS